MEKSVFLPDHVIEEILLRLPVKDLLPWKCVSKRWYALIWDDEFVKKHYGFQYAMHLASQGDVPLLLNFPAYKYPAQFHLLTKQGASDVVVNISPDFERDAVSSTFSRDFERVVVSSTFSRDWRLECIGVVNGIVGLRMGQDRLALWNPASREFKDVPRLLDNKGEKLLNTDIISLGFDLHSNDFKILRLIHNNWMHTRTDYIYEFHLYSLKADSWKIIKDTPGTYPVLDPPSTDAYFSNGVHYWLSNEWGYGRFGIVAFNFSSEIFKEFELPWVEIQFFKDLPKLTTSYEYGCNLSIGKYKEGLALLVTRNLDGKEKCVEIWAAIRFRDDDYEVFSSWELVVKISPIIDVKDVFPWMRTVLDTGDILLFIEVDYDDNDQEVGGGYFTESAYIYRPSTCTFNCLGIKFNSSYRYVESLFPLSRMLNYISA